MLFENGEIIAEEKASDVELELSPFKMTELTYYALSLLAISGSAAEIERFPSFEFVKPSHDNNILMNR